MLIAKALADEFPVTADWSDVLAVGDTIVGATWSVETLTTGTGSGAALVILAVPAPSLTNTTTTGWLAQGKYGGSYLVSVQVVTNLGYTLTRAPYRVETY